MLCCVEACGHYFNNPLMDARIQKCRTLYFLLDGLHLLYY
jgi:hypothetical protein